MKLKIITLAIALNIILYFVIAATWISIFDELTLNISMSVFNLSLTAFLLLLRREKMKIFLASTYCQNSINAYTTSFLILCILCLLNFLAFKHPKQIDFTKNRNNTLSNQTLNVLNSIKGPIHVKIFSPKSNSAHYLALVHLYRYQKNDMEIEVIDPALRPDLVKIYGIQKTGTILFEYKDKKQFVTRTSELEITNALIRISREKSLNLYILIGHGENSFQDKGPEGFSELSSILKKSTYTFEEVDLRSRSSIADNVDLVVIWGPRNDFMEGELKALEDYLQKGGSLLVGLDPDLNKLNVKGLRNFLKKYDIVINNDFVIDVESHVNGSWGTIPLISKFHNSHPITRHFKEKVFFPIASSVQIMKKDGTQGMKLAESSLFPGSWAERNPVELMESRVVFTPKNDEPGPVSMALALEKERSRIVVFGNSSFVSNKYAKLSSNLLLFLNSISWQVGHDELISFDMPAVEKQGPIFISTPQLGIIFYFSVLLTPIILVLLSIYFYRIKIIS